ncbi:substrate-binding domain-containing protein [Fusibacter sp. 3D3]|uniref:substrate-binding domain-containing protein n=1 Tax=Fusibacter sp. 3D3 TaxID=1048380 RepID=UPI0008530DE6|nr:substrate-binding domain-containing protein [Fusibacter sp. 3D3]GAU79561.1 xylose ABC transporter, periplasmic xylose-binding protein XylF [Fusibacter sp. 3D3]
MTIKKGILILLVCTFIGGILCFTQKPILQDDDQVKIGFLVDSLVIERWQKDRDIFISKAKSLGAEVILKNANEDAEIQIEQVKELIEQGVDAIVIIPYDRTSIGPALKLARRNNIKVISYDRLVEKGSVDLYISFDNVLVGQMMGRQIFEKVPSGNYVIINGSPKDHNAFMFNEGYMSVLKPAMDSNQIHVVKEVWAEDWREIYAYDAVSALLDSGVEINGIIGANDDLAEGAIRALLERQLAGMVYVAGHDANLSACQRIVEGTQYVTVYKPIKNLAQRAAEIAVEMVTANGEKIYSEDTIYDGERAVPYIKLMPKLVTKDNLVNVVIKDGFHLLEDVYRNIPKSEWPSE